jgi:hypothetical protein
MHLARRIGRAVEMWHDSSGLAVLCLSLLVSSLSLCSAIRGALEFQKADKRVSPCYGLERLLEEFVSTVLGVSLSLKFR